MIVFVFITAIAIMIVVFAIIGFVMVSYHCYHCGRWWISLLILCVPALMLMLILACMIVVAVALPLLR